MSKYNEICIIFLYNLLKILSKAVAKAESMRDNMHNLFNPDNPVMIILGKIWDLILMNICFVITSLPIFTIGASLTALYRTALSLKENDPEWVHTSYLKAFRKNFRQATFLWLILLAAGVFLCRAAPVFHPLRGRAAHHSGGGQPADSSVGRASWFSPVPSPGARGRVECGRPAAGHHRQ